MKPYLKCYPKSQSFSLGGSQRTKNKNYFPPPHVHPYPYLLCKGQNIILFPLQPQLYFILFYYIYKTLHSTTLLSLSLSLSLSPPSLSFSLYKTSSFFRVHSLISCSSHFPEASGKDGTDFGTINTMADEDQQSLNRGKSLEFKDVELSSAQTEQQERRSEELYKVWSFALKSDNSTINRLEDLLNLDVTPYTNKIIAEYIWIGGSGIDVRSKAKTISKPVEHPSELPKWNYDGSSTGQAPGEDSEVILYPQAIFKDPFRGGNNILVVCDSYTPAGEPIPTNKRHRAAEIFSNKKVSDDVPWFGIEQEYTLLQPNVKWPLGWPVGAYPGPQGPYYCGAGADKSFGRDISDAHYKACLYAGINISGTNGEVMPGQWEYQVGPSVGIDAADHIWCSRYILERITEQAGVVLSLDPKPIEGDWNGAGCHTNYSTKTMREDGGYEAIKKAILNLLLRHKEHISAYGEGNERRLTGKHETASIDSFSWGVANRGCSIRVGRETEKQGKGYLEDRRPASNMDPYIVTSLLAETTILWEPTLESEALAAQKLALNV